MQYLSTRGGIAPISFKNAVMMGLADDGGLLVPESIPNVGSQLAQWRELSYQQLAYQVMRLFADDLSEEQLRTLIEKSYADNFPPEVTPLVELGDLYLLELFHGPTLAFKDLALQFLGNLFEQILEETGQNLNILAATSGDTGSAAIHGVRGKGNINIFVMHPQGRVSPVQERQMTTVLDANVHNIAIEGTFDDGQNILKDLAADIDFKRQLGLGTVNSVNWARVMAQIVYYFKAAFEVQKHTGAASVRFSVPTGNFGDILAGYYARKMGAPIEELLLATNQNDILAHFFKTGLYQKTEVTQTLSPSMDIQVASNFERYLYHHQKDDPESISQLMSGFAASGRIALPVESEKCFDPLFQTGTASRQNTIEEIRNSFNKHDYVLDPHSAVAVSVARQIPASDSRVPTICLATAHPAKFQAAVIEATARQDVGRHPAIDKLIELPTRCQVLPADSQTIKNFMKKTLTSTERGTK
jgi:threonine synthase